MIPLGTFARTEQGFETGRKAFRLTLGGTDPVPALLKKTRRVLIDLNRMISEESANYNRRVFAVPASLRKSGGVERTPGWEQWKSVEDEVARNCKALVREGANTIPGELRQRQYLDPFVKDFVPARLELFRRRFKDRSLLIGESMRRAEADQGRELAEILGREFYKDDLPAAHERFSSPAV